MVICIKQRITSLIFFYESTTLLLSATHNFFNLFSLTKYWSNKWRERSFEKVNGLLTKRYRWKWPGLAWPHVAQGPKSDSFPGENLAFLLGFVRVSVSRLLFNLSSERKCATFQGYMTWLVSYDLIRTRGVFCIRRLVRFDSLPPPVSQKVICLLLMSKGNSQAASITFIIRWMLLFTGSIY